MCSRVCSHGDMQDGDMKELASVSGRRDITGGSDRHREEVRTVFHEQQVSVKHELTLFVICLALVFVQGPHISVNDIHSLRIVTRQLYAAHNQEKMSFETQTTDFSSSDQG